MMKKLSISLVVLLFTSFSFSQDTTRFVVNAGAGELESQEFSMTYYIGDFIQEVDEVLDFAAFQEMVIKEITVYPNPVHSTFNIRSDLPDVGRYLLYDITGILKMEILSNTTKIDLTGYVSGIYFLEVRDREDFSLGIIKIIKN